MCLQLLRALPPAPTGMPLDSHWGSALDPAGGTDFRYPDPLFCPQSTLICTWLEVLNITQEMHSLQQLSIKVSSG